MSSAQLRSAALFEVYGFAGVGPGSSDAPCPVPGNCPTPGPGINPANPYPTLSRLGLVLTFHLVHSGLNGADTVHVDRLVLDHIGG